MPMTKYAHVYVEWSPSRCVAKLPASGSATALRRSARGRRPTGRNLGRDGGPSQAPGGDRPDDEEDRRGHGGVRAYLPEGGERRDQGAQGEVRGACARCVVSNETPTSSAARTSSRRRSFVARRDRTTCGEAFPRRRAVSTSLRGPATSRMRAKTGQFARAFSWCRIGEKTLRAREGAPPREGPGRLPATRPRRLERRVRDRHRASALRTPSDLPPHASLPARRSSSRVPRRSSFKTTRVRKNNLSSSTIRRRASPT